MPGEESYDDNESQYSEDEDVEENKISALPALNHGVFDENTHISEFLSSIGLDFVLQTLLRSPFNEGKGVQSLA